MLHSFSHYWAAFSDSRRPGETKRGRLGISWLIYPGKTLGSPACLHLWYVWYILRHKVERQCQNFPPSSLSINMAVKRAVIFGVYIPYLRLISRWLTNLCLLILWYSYRMGIIPFSRWGTEAQRSYFICLGVTCINKRYQPAFRLTCLTQKHLLYHCFHTPKTDNLKLIFIVFLSHS